MWCENELKLNVVERPEWGTFSKCHGEYGNDNLFRNQNQSDNSDQFKQAYLFNLMEEYF